MHNILYKQPVWWVILIALFCHDSIQAQNKTRLAPYRKGQLWGYANPRTGEVVVSPTFDSVGFFQDEQGFLPIANIKKNGKYGLINCFGEIVVPSASPFPMQVNRICKDFFSTWQLRQEPVLREEENNTDALHNDFALVPTAFFDKNGRFIGEPFVFQTAVDLIGEGGDWEDLNGFQIFADSSHWNDECFQSVWKDKKNGVLDLKKGRLVVSTVWDLIFIQGKIAIAKQRQGANHIARTSLIDLTTGKVVIVPDSIEIIIHDLVPSTLVLASSKQSGLLGFLNKSGQITIPFQYRRAHPFSSNGFTKVLRTDGRWSIIDLSGQEKYQLGRNNGFVHWANGSIWVQSDSDGLFRKKDTVSTDMIGRFGFDYPPELKAFGTQRYWIGARFGKQGLLNTNGQVVLPFEFEAIYPAPFSNVLPQDSSLQKKFFRVQKNGRQWLYDAKTVSPLWPKFFQWEGLTLGETFDKSNFEILHPIVGDSLFVIRLQDRSADILNIQNGKRWGVEGVRGFYISKRKKACEPFIYPQPINDNYPIKRFSLVGQPMASGASNQPSYHTSLREWSYAYEPNTDLTVVLDSLDRTMCKIRIPFAGEGNTLMLLENKGSHLYPFVFLAQSTKGESAVFSLDGHLLSPPYIWKAAVSNDLLFATMNEMRGVYRLTDGREILPCAYRWVDMRYGALLAFDLENRELWFDLEGKLLRAYPKGYSSKGGLSNGLQLVYHGGRYMYYNEMSKLAFSLDSIVNASPFSEGLGSVNIDGLGWKYIDTQGRQAFSGYFDYAGSFHRGRAVVRTRDGWTKVIDTHGMTILQAASNADPYISNVSLLGNNVILKRDAEGQHFFSLDGKPILKKCSCFEEYPHNDSIHFYCDRKLGWLFPNGKIKWIEQTDFHIENHREKGRRWVLNAFECEVEGYMDQKNGKWMVVPKPNQSIYASQAQDPFLRVYSSENSTEQLTVIDKRSGAVVPLEPGDLTKLEGGLGWLLVDYPAQKAFLYSPDLKTKRPWNYRYNNIYWNEALNLFEVTDMESNFIGYISKERQVLFEH